MCETDREQVLLEAIHQSMNKVVSMLAQLLALQRDLVRISEYSYR